MINEPFHFMGTSIRTDDTMVEIKEDWSSCRSLGRARRRRRRGFQQRVKVTGVPSKKVISIDNGRVLVMHPETYRALKDRLGADILQRGAA